MDTYASLLHPTMASRSSEEDYQKLLDKFEALDSSDNNKSTTLDPTHDSQSAYTLKKQLSSLRDYNIANEKRTHLRWAWHEFFKEYDAIIIGGGGHGLATAYYLAKKHNMTNIAVVEKGWIGGGNTGRNTTIIRSNYLWDASAALYDHALKICEGLSQELNYLSLIHN